MKEINFVYGSNGTGKTTISRVIADCESHPDCALDWRDGTPIEMRVYNRDFVERSFNQPDELKGIFTLGEEDWETLEKIDTAKSELNQIKLSYTKFKTTLSGEDGKGGKQAELEALEGEFEIKCWDLKLKHDDKLQGAFAGARNSKKVFKEKLIDENSSNSSSAAPIEGLEKRAETVFGPTPQQAPLLPVPQSTNLLAHETNGILGKRVIGRPDVDIAGLIQKLGNSDWVKQGRSFYNPEERVCPFCQQDTPHSLEDSLNEYFDDMFQKDTDAIEKLYTDYKTDAERIQQGIETLLKEPSKFLDAEGLQAESDLLDSKIYINIQHLKEKRRESSKSIDLDSLRNVLETVEKLIVKANKDIQKRNDIVANLETEKNELTGQVWRYLLDHEIKTDLGIYNGKKAGLSNAIENLETQLHDKAEKKKQKEQDIRNLEKDTTSIQPTINGINALLNAFGFTGFALEKSDRDRFYKIQRSDGTDAKKTLSEGETSFITFLYFYHLLKGSETESGMTSDRIVVFDDPVSSLDSDILFIVSILIKDIFVEVRKKIGNIKQVFVLTHNVYFHKEVSFNPKNQTDRGLKDETFWTVRKSNQESRVQGHESNPVKTSYELLWIEIRKPDRNNLAIQNTMRRILENYYTILGNVNFDRICAEFEGEEKPICRSLFSWVHDGSHFAHDSLYVSIDDSMVEIYLNIFKEIFIRTGHLPHYEMMMDRESDAELVVT